MDARAAATPDALAATVDLDRFPLDAPDGAACRDLVARVRADLADVGCAVLRDFVRPGALARATAEARDLARRAVFETRYLTPYSTFGDESLPSDHPRRLVMERSSGFVDKSKIPPGYTLRRLYHDGAFQRFVADCNGLDVVHEYADPLAGFVINVLPPGSQQEWHFDTNEFIATVLTQAPEAGGEFLYCPGIRSPEDEGYDAIRGVLTGEDPSPVRRLDLRPGDLQLFLGRWSLHRVARVGGAVERHTSVFAYAERPGMIGRLQRTRDLYGTTLDVHATAEAAGLDPDVDYGTLAANE